MLPLLPLVFRRAVFWVLHCLILYLDFLNLFPLAPVWLNSRTIIQCPFLFFTLQITLFNVINFSDENGLVLNYLKCHYIFISFKPNCNSIQVENITEKNSVKILGVHFTNDLKWDLHFSHIVKKANQRFYALCILRPYLNNNDLKTAYYAFIRSLLEYCSPLFVGINQKLCDILERIQTRFHNLLCNINCNCNSLVCLKTRRSNASVKLFTRISADSEHLLYNLIPKCHHKLYCMPFCRTTRRLSSFIPTVTLLVNSADFT